MNTDRIAGSAIISPCGLYRLRLERKIADAGPSALLAGVNPSTADATVNKFAFRATDVRELAQASDPIGPGNNDAIRQAMADADIIVFAWGPLAKLPKRLRTRWRFLWETANELGKQPMCFGAAKDGHPLHTLMIPYSSELRPWRPAL